jgi:hypothetical protein
MGAPANTFLALPKEGVPKKPRREQFFSFDFYPRRESNPHLRFRKPPFYPLNYGDGKKDKSKKDEGRSPSAAPSAAEQARVEVEIDRRMNADAFEIRMLGIEQEICIGWTDGTWQSQHRRALLLNPKVANFHGLGWRRRNAPVRRQFFRRKNFRETVGPFQTKRFVFLLENEWHPIREHFKRSGGLMFAYVDDTHPR